MSLKILFNSAFALNGARRIQKSSLSFIQLHKYVTDFTVQSILKTREVKLLYKDLIDGDMLIIDSEETWMEACNNKDQTTLIVNVEPIIAGESITIKSENTSSSVVPVEPVTCTPVIKNESVQAIEVVEPVIPMGADVKSLWRRSHREESLGSTWYNGIVQAYDQIQQVYTVYYTIDGKRALIPRTGIRYTPTTESSTTSTYNASNYIPPKFAVNSKVDAFYLKTPESALVKKLYSKTLESAFSKKLYQAKIIAYDSVQKLYTVMYNIDYNIQLLFEQSIRYNLDAAKYKIGQSVSSKSHPEAKSYIQSFDAETGNYQVTVCKVETFYLDESQVEQSNVDYLAGKFQVNIRVMLAAPMIEYNGNRWVSNQWVQVLQNNPFTKQYLVQGHLKNRKWVNEVDIVGTALPKLLLEDTKTIVPEFRAALVEIYRRYAKVSTNKNNSDIEKVMDLNDFNNYWYSCQIHSSVAQYHCWMFYRHSIPHPLDLRPVLTETGFIEYYTTAATNPQCITSIWGDLFAHRYNGELKLLERKFKKGEVVRARSGDSEQITDKYIVQSDEHDGMVTLARHSETLLAVSPDSTTGIVGPSTNFDINRVWWKTSQYCVHCITSEDDPSSLCNCTGVRKYVQSS